MKIILFILTLICLCIPGYSQTNSPKRNKKIIRDFEKDINTLLPVGEVVVDIMDRVTMSPRRAELMSKFLIAAKKYPDFILQRQKLAEETGNAGPYDPRLGLTIEEKRELDSLSDDLSDMFATTSDTARVLILKKGSIISFKTNHSRLSYLNFLTIDSKNNIVKILNYTLTPSDTICVTKENNIYKTKWRGYNWEFSNKTSKIYPSNQSELLKFSMEFYKLTIGLFEKTGETFFEFKGNEITNGKSTLNYEVPIVF